MMGVEIKHVMYYVSSAIPLFFISRKRELLFSCHFPIHQKRRKHNWFEAQIVPSNVTRLSSHFVPLAFSFIIKNVFHNWKTKIDKTKQLIYFVLVTFCVLKVIYPDLNLRLWSLLPSLITTFTLGSSMDQGMVDVLANLADDDEDDNNMISNTPLLEATFINNGIAISPLHKKDGF